MGNKISKKSESLDNWNNINTDSMSSNIMPSFENINKETKELIKSLNLNEKYQISVTNSDSETDNIFNVKKLNNDEKFSDTSPFINAEISKYNQFGGSKNEMLTSSSSSLKKSESSLNSNDSDLELSYVSSSAHTHENSENSESSSKSSDDYHIKSNESTEIFSKDSYNHNNSLESTELSNKSAKATDSDKTISVKNNSILSSINTSDINVITE